MNTLIFSCFELYTPFLEIAKLVDNKSFTVRMYTANIEQHERSILILCIIEIIVANI